MNVDDLRHTCLTLLCYCFSVPELEWRESPRLQWRLQLSLMRSLWPGGDRAWRKHKLGHDKTSTPRENTNPRHDKQTQCKRNLGTAFLFGKEERKCRKQLPFNLMNWYADTLEQTFIVSASKNKKVLLVFSLFAVFRPDMQWERKAAGDTVCLEHLPTVKTTQGRGRKC